MRVGPVQPRPLEPSRQLEQRAMQSIAEMTEVRAVRREHWLRRFLRFCRSKPLGGFGAVALVIMVLVAAFAEPFSTFDPVATDGNHTLMAPSSTYFFGTDFLGRDMYSRIVHGTRVSLAVGLVSTIMGGAIGLVLGLISGYLLGWWDQVIQRVMDVMQGLPLLVMALVMAAALGPS